MQGVEFTLPQPGDAEYTWEHESMHTPHALPALSGDFFGAVIKAIDNRFKSFGLPMQIDSRVINGYTYVAQYSNDPALDMKGLMEQVAPLRLSAARDVRRAWKEDILPELEKHYEWLRHSPIPTLEFGLLANEWAKAWELASDVYGLHFQITGGAYPALDHLMDFYESVFEDATPGEALKLIQGHGEFLYRVQKDLFDLATFTGSKREITDALTAGTHDLEALRILEGGDDFTIEFRKFLELHGHLGHAYDDLSQPSWSDEPERVIEELRKRLLTPQEDPAEKRSRLLREADELADSVRAKLAGREKELEQFEDALALARDAGPLTEDHNYLIDRMFQTLMRRFVLRVGGRLVEAEVIEAPDDVFFLHAGEIEASLHNPKRMLEEIIGRRRDLELWQSVEPPKTLGKTDQDQSPKDRFFSEFDDPNPDPDKRVLRGHAACPGKASGRASLVMSSADFSKVQPGDILVCGASNPSYVPLFGVIAGLVTETGGVVSHAAVLAREFGVPAVVGTKRATSIIEDGQNLEVDGDRGEVRLF